MRPDGQQGVFAHTNVILGLGDLEYVKPGTSPIVAALTAGKALADLMNDLAKHKAGKGGDDLTTALLDAELDGETLTQPELASFFVLLVVAGNETTRNAISHGMRALCDFPEQRAKCGWYLARTRGSHQQFKHATKPGLVSVAGKSSDDLAPGTLNSVLDQAGLKQ